MPAPFAQRLTLRRFAWLSIAAALVTIGLKGGAYLLTGSVGLLSDALESLVNLVAALVALLTLDVAAREPDEEHAYGHAKAEYFSSGLEGMLIIVAALGIAVTAVPRLFQPQPIENLGSGLLVSAVAAVVNLAVAWRLLQAAREYRSVTLEGNARHLLTDVWTTAAVLAGIGLVGLTGWDRLDPLLALAVAANILWTGGRLLHRSLHGLLDRAWPAPEQELVDAILARYRERHGIETHALRTREAGARRFMSVHVLVPGAWSVQRGHHLLDRLEQEIQAALPGTTVFTHLESLDDPASWDDMALDRAGVPTATPR